MFNRLYNYEIMQKNEDQPKYVSTVRQKQRHNRFLHTSAPPDPIDLLSLLRFWAIGLLVHIIRTTYVNFYTTDPIGLLYRQGSAARGD